jgi:hypothetical protein
VKPNEELAISLVAARLLKKVGKVAPLGLIPPTDNPSDPRKNS